MLVSRPTIIFWPYFLFLNSKCLLLFNVSFLKCCFTSDHQTFYIKLNKQKKTLSTLCIQVQICVRKLRNFEPRIAQIATATTQNNSQYSFIGETVVCITLFSTHILFTRVNLLAKPLATLSHNFRIDKVRKNSIIYTCKFVGKATSSIVKQLQNLQSQ